MILNSIYARILVRVNRLHEVARVRSAGAWYSGRVAR